LTIWASFLINFFLIKKKRVYDIAVTSVDSFTLRLVDRFFDKIIILAWRLHLNKLLCYEIYVNVLVCCMVYKQPSKGDQAFPFLHYLPNELNIWSSSRTWGSRCFQADPRFLCLLFEDFFVFSLLFSTKTCVAGFINILQFNFG